eukprot:m.217225 g.217225  ORF g.217225 m.217225 type:complete len:70 (+) comp50931_c0_seq1:68-277(+)
MMKRGPSAEPNPLYLTTNGGYGSKPMHAAIATKKRHGQDPSFTNALGQAGMYRNCSLNTALDKTRTPVL